MVIIVIQDCKSWQGVCSHGTKIHHFWLIGLISETCFVFFEVKEKSVHTNDLTFQNGIASNPTKTSVDGQKQAR